MAITHLASELNRTYRPVQSLEPRDADHAIQHWQRNTWGKDCVPLLDTFDFSPMKTSWAHRCLICGGPAVESSVFVSYGSGFARLLGLPAKPVTTIPFIQQVPAHHREMFSEGCSKA